NGSRGAREYDIAGHQAIHVAVGLVHRAAAVLLRQPQIAAIDLGPIAMRVIYPPVRHICADDACDPRSMKGPVPGMRVAADWLSSLQGGSLPRHGRGKKSRRRIMTGEISMAK